MEKYIIHRKIMITLTAIEIINDLGIQRVSTKEIANRQGIAESTIYKHFNSKNEIILSVLDYYSQFDKDIIISAKKQAIHAIESIEIFINAYTEYYENYPAITSITQSYVMLLNNPAFVEKIKNIILHREEFVRGKLEEAKAQKLIDPAIDSEALADIFFGTFNRICCKWRMSNYNFSLKEKTLFYFQMFLNYIKA